MVKNILFDFDGVILNSMPIKEFGFREIFREYPQEYVEELINFHNRNGGISRFIKIEYFFNDILKERISQERVLELADEFSEIMRRELVNKKYLIKETIDFLEMAKDRFQLHIVSGAEERELQFLCQKLDVEKYFITINGSPTPKKFLVQKLMDRFQYKREETILIGDSKNDREASAENGITFYGFNNTQLKEDGCKYIDSFNNFKI